MLGWIKSLFAFEPAEKDPDYKIVHDPRLGFMGCYSEHGAWWGLTAHGTDGADIDSAMDPFYGHRYWCGTEEEAGQRINLHATKGGRKTVWEG